MRAQVIVVAGVLLTSLAWAGVRERAEEATRLYRQGKYEDAAVIFAELAAKVSQDRDRLAFIWNLGYCYYYLGRPKEAISHFREYLAQAKGLKKEQRDELTARIAEMEEQWRKHGNAPPKEASNEAPSDASAAALAPTPAPEPQPASTPAAAPQPAPPPPAWGAPVPASAWAPAPPPPQPYAQMGAPPPGGYAPPPAPYGQPQPPPAESPRAPTVARAGRPERAIELGLRAGYAMPGGKTGGVNDGDDGEDLSEFVEHVIPVMLEANLRLSQQFAVGTLLQYGFGTSDNLCSDIEDGGGDCSVRVLRLGLQALFTPVMTDTMAFWVGAGLGYESYKWEASAGDSKGSIGLTGFEWLHLQAGLDLFVGQAFRVGPFASFGLGKYGEAELELDGSTESADLENPAFHHWITIGARAMFDIGI